MGLLPLTYTRPKYVPQESFSGVSIATTDDGGSDKEISPRSDVSVRSGQSGQSGIPDSLTFDRIMNGGTCPPMTLRDFMNYLVYIEHSAENLQFFLWYKDYCRRFEAIPASEKALAPEWTLAMHEDTVAKIRKGTADKRRPEVDVAQQIFKGSDFDKQAGEAFSPPSHLHVADHQPLRTPPDSRHSEQTTCYAPSSSGTTDYKAQASDAFHSAGATQPFTIQPFRDEINRVIATYIMYSSPRQLNLSSWEQKATVQALSQTTHPTALRDLVKSVESSLRGQSHPNFVRWSICNGNPARVTFARGLGLFLIVAGFAMAVVLTLSSLGRGYRAFAALAWVLGISTLVAAWKGMCVVLHGLHHRHIRPWELFEQDDASMAEEEEKLSKESFESFGSSNSYEDEPWVVKYQKRNVVRKIFDREIWVQEPALRQIQDTIFVQALLSGALGGGLLTLVFVLVPGPKLF
ncbi:uncharacterized protein J7T54_002751 [Emericellopsis cladophorae]|uniref:RGS domain-containing protein n=1 Tax=Emericellopsis cladophorae TaxID=2686198 RepID=A0A9P9XU42_9HYPO|nr:uncharacterized protein J7T54_002751 [Emericellopsis cladophorae]KAI6777853.1 hypothetical protein J7T54_002751 [Emericellopsis cladophorae]